ncbi:MAG: fatty acid desaturase [Flavobacteriales bacterium]|jgi:omega-6 fatty acid desaturase (delta-12 desaturase)|nr:fatty acid desaturase [Flavobacteriales bacterium]
MEAPAPPRVTVKHTGERKDLILATRPFALEQRARSWMHLFVSVVVTAGCYFGTVYFDPLWSKAAFGVLTGLALVRLFILYHDHQHKSILNRSKPADAFFWFFGMWMLSPPSIWKRSHDHHHKHNCKLYTSSIGSFPVVTVEKYKSLTRSERFAYNFIRSPFAIGLGYVFVFIIGMCLNSFISNRGRHWDSLITLVFHSALGFTTWWFLGWENLVFAFFLPYLVTFALGSYLFYAQHNFPGTVFADKDGWSYVKAALDSSSYMKMNPVLQWFTGNIGFHHVHHLNAHIPFYRLPEAHRAIPELREKAKRTSLWPWDIVACFRLKAWDPALQRMVSRQELRHQLSR